MLTNPPKEMPLPLRAMYAHFVDYYTETLHIRQHYQDLFSNPKAVEMLSRTAIMLFFYIRACMAQQQFLAIARMMDPAKTLGRDNLSLEGLISAIPDSEGKLRASLLLRIHRLRKTAKGITLYRHKHIAHIDLHYAMGEKKLRAVKNRKLDAVLSEIGKILQRLHKRYVGSHIDYRPGNTGRGPNQLFNRLSRAEAYDVLERNRAIPANEWCKYSVLR